MNTLLTMVCWAVLFILCWPLAVVVLVLWPIVWLVALPFRLAGVVVSAALAMLRAILFLPARLLGGRAVATAA